MKCRDDPILERAGTLPCHVGEATAPEVGGAELPLDGIEDQHSAIGELSEVHHR
ncbi:MAG: hypothetical protein IPO52_10475 [Gemmatimonadetes bacterium]|nr:hypothetical protein [Gemmatimonadota bacterium]